MSKTLIYFLGCVPGYTLSDSGVCIPCPIGTFKPFINDYEFKYCPQGTTTVDVGQTSSDACSK